MPSPAKNLGELLAGLPGMGFGPWRQTLVTGIAIDSRRVSPGDLFAALPGQRSHGANFIDESVARGAAAILAPIGTALPTGLPGYLVSDTREALPTVSSRFYDHPARELRLTGVTGSNGKTTVVAMLARILNEAGLNTAYWSTNEVSNGGRRFRPDYTTPEAPELHRFLREARINGHREALIEVSSHAVTLNRIAGLPFSAGVVTNLSPDHLDFHGSLEEYRAAKQAFVTGLAPGATVLLNADDPEVYAFQQAAKCRVLSFGLGPDSDLGAEDLTVTQAPLQFRLRLGSRITGDEVRFLPVEIPLLGKHNVLNALGAIGVALSFGVPAERAVRALAGFEPPARRLATLEVGPYLVISDVAMNPGSYQAVLAAVASLQRPVVVVNSLRGNRGPQVNRDSATALALWEQRLHFAPVILTASREHLESLTLDYRVRPEEQAAFLTEAKRQGLPVSFHWELETAIAEGIARLPARGVLLLLGTFGMDLGASLAAAKLREL